jgi:hypothetical protein
MVTVWHVIAVTAFAVGVVVVALFFLGPRE